MDKNYDPTNLAKIFGVENLITPKSLVSETDREVRRKYPHEATEDIRALLDEVNLRVVSKDIIGVVDALNAIQLRLDYLKDVANDIRKAQGK